MQNLWLLLFLLACPLMMVFMMRGMHGGGDKAGHADTGHDDHVRDPASADERDRRIAELEHEIVSLRKEDPANPAAVRDDGHRR